MESESFWLAYSSTLAVMHCAALAQTGMGGVDLKKKGKDQRSTDNGLDLSQQEKLTRLQILSPQSSVTFQQAPGCTLGLAGLQSPLPTTEQLSQLLRSIALSATKNIIAAPPAGQL